jgi:hypothetical protein
MKTNLFDKKGNEIKINDTIRFFKVGHPSFSAKVYYAQGAIRENKFGRCLWDYTLACLGKNIINGIIL